MFEGDGEAELRGKWRGDAGSVWVGRLIRGGALGTDRLFKVPVHTAGIAVVVVRARVCLIVCPMPCTRGTGVPWMREFR